MAFLEITGLTKRFGAAAALDGVSLRVEGGEWFGLLGPSGAGKTTLLRLVAGLEPPDGGSIALDGRRLSRPGLVEPPERRGIGMVFQTLGLWPHLDARGHVDLVLRRTHPRRADRDRETVRLLALARLEDKAARRPGELSGGERQRLAVARALAPRPDLLLLDEPFAHVDEPLRDDLAADLAALIRVAEATVLLVSHDAEHVAALCDRLAILHEGRIEQVGAPREIDHSPATAAAARMTGPVFLVEGQAAAGEAATALGALPLRDPRAAGAGHACLRPESFDLLDAGDSGEASSHPVRVNESVFLAGRWRTTFHLADHEFWTWTGEAHPAGEALVAALRPAAWIPRRTIEMRQDHCRQDMRSHGSV